MAQPTPFPSLAIGSEGFEAQGAFAEAQAEFLDPDPQTVARLRTLLDEHRAGVVAHFYMDAELQGVLTAAEHEHVHISDSLLMADRAVAMAEDGVRHLVVLGVDFMSENVRAMLDASGHTDVAVYRAAADPIGCSLAESAEGPAYRAYLERAATTPKAVHVVYINTSLRTKAHAHARVPTITCTSSNVVKTVLQIFAEEPEAEVFFGPDTYMGENLRALFTSLTKLGDEQVRALHPAHDRASVARSLPRFHFFEQGNCVVHHMFGASVVERVRRGYADAHITAHLEVPGEMFELALEAQREGRGVVGSTSNILEYIGSTLANADAESGPLRFVLGTEAGMITAIVRRVREALASRQDAGLRCEIVFPVADEAVATTQEQALPIVPGVAGGEGCSTAGGCATCPYMKMNHLDALLDVLERTGQSEGLEGHAPRTYDEEIDGRSVAAVGSEPILHMRAFQRSGKMPAELLQDLRTRATG